ncbi:PREDICTED: immune-associated nucleotide-binding protein 8-like [Nelumbo nucifera]|uniref:Immune-associated nucleotide-binding protein 8-like n=2 Tax=Nelumbo nucifera TaxID=4432 RepID=A0A1U8AAY2_NELNU|nr:PREDICTED: immune-associated nucleotide-binding protein 8-like [Nelumbo nucifera]DAD36871.1 TPA_asm: hypothetical protein HUJ06_007512 [Nelumbo nucifera]
MSLKEICNGLRCWFDKFRGAPNPRQMDSERRPEDTYTSPTKKETTRSTENYSASTTSNNALTMALLGNTGNGVSATGNSILKMPAFESKRSSGSVTSTSEMKDAVVDGKLVKVIDTPGLFNFLLRADFVVKEIVKCIESAKDGIHAVVVVLSVRSPYSKEEVTAIQGLKILFGDKISDYLIFVFTGGDELEDDQTLDDYLEDECPQPLKEFLKSYRDRTVLFDNKTKNDEKKDNQVKQFLSIVDTVVAKNGGKPYKNEFFVQLHERTDKTYEERLKEVRDKVASKLKQTISKLQQQLAEEKSDPELARETKALRMKLKDCAIL